MILSALLLALGQGAHPDTSPPVAYWIEARLDEAAGVLHARGTLSYRNHAPDTLSQLYLHLHLNAFRPNSIWAQREERPHLDFQSLREPHTAFERLRRAAIGAAELSPAYPHAPDSTVVRLELPRPLAPGDSLELTLEWEGRLSTLWRRQGRWGRHYDWAHWYPRVAAYDRYGWQAHPLYPQGEFYGAFATYDVTLDLPEDQVVAATGVPVEGDPGWGRAAAEVRHRRAPSAASGRRWAGGARTQAGALPRGMGPPLRLEL